MILKILTAFTIITGVAYAHESPHSYERDCPPFMSSYQVGKETGDQLKLSGEFLYFAQGVGLTRKKGKFEPGYRVTLEKEGFLKYFDLGVSYMHWEAKREKTFSMPIVRRVQTVSNKDDLDDLEVTVRYPLSSWGILRVTAFCGIDWDWRDNRVTTTYQDTFNRQRSWGPLVGTCVGAQLTRYLSVNGRVSIASLEGNYQRTIDQTIAFEKRCFGPKSKCALEIQGIFPLRKGSLKVKGGYETQYLWMRGVDRLVGWTLPLYLQGFLAEVSLDF